MSSRTILLFRLNRVFLLGIISCLFVQYVNSATYSGDYNSPVVITENSSLTGDTSFNQGLTVNPGVTLVNNDYDLTIKADTGRPVIIQGTVDFSGIGAILLLLDNGLTGDISIDGGLLKLYGGCGGLYGYANSFQVINGGVIELGVAGTLSTDQGTPFNVVGTGSKIYVNGGVFRNNRQNYAGVVNFQSGGMLHLASGAVYNNPDGPTNYASLNFESGGIFRIDGGTLYNERAYDAVLSMSTAAQVIINGGDIENTHTFSFLGADLSSSIRPLQSGVLHVTAAESSSVPLYLISGQSLEIGSGAEVRWDNKVNIYGGTITNGGTMTSVSGGDFFSNGTLVNNGTFSAGTGTVDNAGVMTNNSSISTGGTFGNSGTLTNNATFNSSTGFTNSGVTTLASGTFSISPTINNTGTINVNGGSFPLNGNTINNNGTVELNISLENNTSTVNNNDTFNISVNGEFINSQGTLTNDGLLFNEGYVLNIDTIVNNVGKTITNDGTFIVFGGSTFTNNGTIDGSGDFIDLNQPGSVTLPETTITIPSGATVSFGAGTEVNMPGKFINLSSATVDIFGTIYAYNTIENGGATAGRINIHHPGNLYMMGGALENKHADSEVNIKQGGSLYNYYGTVDITTGGADSLDISAGGKFDNVRGNHPGSFTTNDGALVLDGGEICLCANLDLDSTWTITGKATIKGCGNKITLMSSGAIVVQGDDSSLLFEDLVLAGVSGNKIRCTDNNTTLSIHNVVWHQDANYSCTKGSFYVDGDWLITGRGTDFAYQTDQISTVTNNSTIHMLLTTFDYDTSTGNNLFNLVDKTSVMHLEHGTLKASQGCALSNGTLMISGFSVFQGDAILNLSGLDDIDVAGSLHRLGTIIL